MPYVELLSYTPNPEYVIETAYLQCRNLSDNIDMVRATKNRKDRIHSMFASGHLGLLEHAYATFSISGISRSCTHQLVRHRIASYAQLSMRSVNCKDLKAVVPPEICRNQEANMIYVDQVIRAFEVYEKLLELGIEKEDARFVLPIGTETEIVVSMNFRSWIHFLKLRLDPNAQWEIRMVAEEIHKELSRIAPNVFDLKYREYWE